MLKQLFFLLWFFLPVGLANMAPVFAARLPLLRNWNYPLDGYAMFRGQRLLGNNKTIRGLIFGAAVSVIITEVQFFLVSQYPGLFVQFPEAYLQASPFLLGLLLGIGALGGDAIKSFFKRQHQIGSGQTWFPFDQLDYVLGAIVATFWYAPLSFRQYGLLLVLGLILHLLVGYIAYKTSFRGQEYNVYYRLWLRHIYDVLLYTVSFIRSIGFAPRPANPQAREQLVWVSKSNLTGPVVPGGKLTIFSWNVFKAFHREILLPVLHEHIQDHAPAVVLLQEAPQYPDGSFLPWPEGFVPTAFSYVSSYKSSPRFAWKSDFENTGQLTASRYPFIESEFYLLPVVSDRRYLKAVTEYLHRSVLYTRMRAGRGTLGIYNIHLENMATPRGRLHQAEYLYELVEKNRDDAVILGGDFNFFMSQRAEPAFWFLKEKGFTPLPQSGTFRLIPQLDYVFIRGIHAEARILRGAGSDHWPLLVTVDLE